MVRQYELVEKVKSYDKNVDEDALNRAYVFAMQAHFSQKRASGDPYFSHPLEVAGILADLKLDGATIITALLHDTVEDTKATLADIERLFGDEVARLVDGVTKLSKIEFRSIKSQQAQNFRKLLLAMSEDIRVLLVKLADRLHNMRTLHHIPKEEKRKRIAAETLEIYAPLSERIGLHEIKNELEDLAFKQMNPEAYESISNRLNYLKKINGPHLIDEILIELNNTLTKAGIKAKVTGREKTPYSVWRKMQRYNLAFEQLGDIMAFRVVVDKHEDCYKALGAMHEHYIVFPGRFKDYISTPKPNGYRSIHTGLIGPRQQRIEVQIRTQSMHEINEWGVAAHWLYKKDGQNEEDEQHSGKKFKWMRELLDILENASDPDEFLEHTKLEMYQDQVFCFSPKGDLISLPRGATPVDFAYAVHSEVGNHCMGSRINGRLLPLRTKLKNGDQVEIITSKTQQPSPTWEQFVITGKAKAAIRRFIRIERREQFIQLGRGLIQGAFKQVGQAFKEKLVADVLEDLGYDSLDDLYAMVGEGIQSSHEIVNMIHPSKPAEEDELKTKSSTKTRTKNSAYELPIRGLIAGMAIHYAKCCHPIPGDKIVGVVTTGKGVTIHVEDCDNLENIEDVNNRLLDVTWEKQAAEGGAFVSRLSLILLHQPGAFGTVSTVLGHNNINIVNIKFANRTNEFFEMLIDVEVLGTQQLDNAIAILRTLPVVQSVDRVRS